MNQEPIHFLPLKKFWLNDRAWKFDLASFTLGICLMFLIGLVFVLFVSIRG